MVTLFVWMKSLRSYTLWSILSIPRILSEFIQCLEGVRAAPEAEVEDPLAKTRTEHEVKRRNPNGCQSQNKSRQAMIPDISRAA